MKVGKQLVGFFNKSQGTAQKQTGKAQAKKSGGRVYSLNMSKISGLAGKIKKFVGSISIGSHFSSRNMSISGLKRHFAKKMPPQDLMQKAVPKPKTKTTEEEGGFGPLVSEEATVRTARSLDRHSSTLSDSQVDRLASKFDELTTSQREAKFGRSGFYSYDKFSQKSGEYHQKGDQWSEAQLEEFFANGLFQQYVGDLNGFDYEFNYSDSARVEESDRGKYDKRKFGALSLQFPSKKGVVEAGADGDVALAGAVKELFKPLREDRAFLQLGAAMQKEKVQVEKLDAEMSKLGAAGKTEEAGELLQKRIALDARTEKRQKIIYNWTKEYSSQVKEFVSKQEGPPAGWDLSKFAFKREEFLQPPLEES